MKEGIHPEYREVVFLDQQTGNKFISRSTLHSRETIERPDWGARFIKLIGDAFLVGTTNNPIE